MFTIEHINELVKGKWLLHYMNATIEHLHFDSRKITFAEASLFLAIPTSQRSGIDFLENAYQKGVRNFIVQEKINVANLKEANIIIVKNVIRALQTIALEHRKQFNLETIAITGSNGKTIVKEWLYQLLYNDYNIVRSPKSYNSQIGVPISIWEINEHHNLGIFEAGISTQNEMHYLQKIIKPTIGIFTNIGAAHNEGFKDNQVKIQEKLQLFINCSTLFYCANYTEIEKQIVPFAKEKQIELISWGYNSQCTIRILKVETSKINTIVRIKYLKNTFVFSLPFLDAASIENSLHCISLLLFKRYNEKQIVHKLKSLQTVSLRLEQKKGVNHCIIINDSYSNDITSLELALNYLNEQPLQYKKTIVLTDLQQSGIAGKLLYKKVALLLKQKNVDRLIAIGTEIGQHSTLFRNIQQTQFFYTTEEALLKCKPEFFNKEIILFKGARIFSIERIAHLLEEKVHQTILEINIEKLKSNIKAYQKIVRSSTKIMAVVKAFGYGNGSVEVARVLQQMGIAYLAVAYTDEGVTLRKAGIHLPIMVMNVDEYGFDAMIEHELEPEIYSKKILESFLAYAKKNALSNYPIHVKLDTGMHRLGFEEYEIDYLTHILYRQNLVKVKTVFSHLVGSEASNLDSFTKQQNKQFCKMAEKIESVVGYSILKHIANSSAIERHTFLQHDMVRLGIGMYGVVKSKLNLQQVCTLKTTIAQIKNVVKGDTVGYNRKGLVKKDSKIATIRIGYADGYSRQLGNGIGKVMVNHQLVPVIGSVCMDMTMIDITGVTNVSEGDYVILFGENPSVQQMAIWSHTIAYEILTNISERVKRVYVE